MVDIKYFTIKQYLLDKNIRSPKEYLNQYKAKTLPSNFPYGIVSYLKRHDSENFISNDDLFPNKKPKKRKRIIVYGNRFNYEEIVEIIRPLGMTTHSDWRDYINSNKNNWDNRIPKTPKTYYSKLNKWISWKHFLVGEKSIREKMSQGEREIFRLLSNEGHFFEMNKKFDDLKGGKLSYDFYIPTFNQLIEYDGIYHFQLLNRKQEALDKQISNDHLKDDYAPNKNFRFKRISYLKHNSIPKILYELGLISDSNLKLLYSRKVTRIYRPIPKNYKYNHVNGTFTYGQVDEIRKQYLLGYDRKEVENILGITIHIHVFKDIVRNRNYFNSNYNPKNRIIKIKPIKIKPVKLDPLLLAEFNLLKAERRKIKPNYIDPRLEQIKILKEELFNFKENYKSIPKKEILIETTVSDLKLDSSNFVMLANYKQYNRYTYENFIFVNRKTAGEITCQIHGSFFQAPHAHLSVVRGSQCPKCANLNRNNPLPWRDIRELKTYKKKTTIKTRVNKDLTILQHDLIKNLEQKIINLNKEIKNGYFEIDEKISEVKFLLYSNINTSSKTLSVRKLIYDDVVYIHENPNLGMKKLATYFSVDRSTIKRIRKGLSYKEFSNKYFETQKILPEKFLETKVDLQN